MAVAALLALASPTAISHPAEKAGAAAATAFYKVRKPARGRRERRRRSRAAAASREGGRRNRRGRAQTLRAHHGARRVSARGPGAVRGRRARERGFWIIKGPPLRSLLNVPRTSLLSLSSPPAAVSASGHLMRFIHARLSFVQGWQMQCTGFPTTVFFSRPFPSSCSGISSLDFHLVHASCVPGTRVYL